MQDVRRPVLLLIALSAIAPALVYGYAVAAFFSERAVARPLLLGGVFAWLVFRVVSGATSNRLSEYERTILTFWSRTPFFVVMTAIVLGALPLIVLPRVAGYDGWKPSPLLASWMAALVLMLAGGAVWNLWRRFQASLSDPDRDGSTTDSP